MQLKRINIKKLTVSALFAAVICIVSPFVIQIGVVPLSLANLAVMLCAFTLPASNAVLSVAVYLLLGLCGLPVFASFAGGAQVLFGATGGFLWGYIPLCVFLSFAKLKNNFVYRALMCFCGMLCCYTLGVMQYCIVLKASVLSGLLVCVAPFFVFDIIKCVLAYLFSKRVKEVIKI